jgi:D-alanine-D-alanine ligase
VEKEVFACDPQGEAERVSRDLLPAVVKPVRQGSSIGITMVGDPAELLPALEAAFACDNRVLVEERIAGREFTVASSGIANSPRSP